MRFSRLFLVALPTALACSVYSESLLHDGAGSTLDSGSLPDSGEPDGAGATSGNGGSQSSSGSSGSGASGGSGGDAGIDGPIDTGDGGCVGSAGAGGDDDIDCCPADDTKTDPGICGCGMPDSDGDTDGTLDCLDGCPTDGQKTEPGSCGCGYVDASCTELKAALAHRYSFGGTGTEATDSVGGEHGTVVGGMLSGGAVVLAGLTSDQHVDLPDGLISVLMNATFEIWSNWQGGSQWQRLFDFGDQNTSGSMTGRTYLFLTPLNAQSTARATFKKLDTAEVIVNDDALFPAVVQSHAAVVIDDTGDTMSLYVQGVLKSSIALTDSLSDINDVNNWLGKSNYNVDPEFSGSITEFRIYGAALTEAQLGLSYALGPDPMFLAP